MTMSGVEGRDLLVEHSCEAGIRVVGGSSTGATADGTVEAFKAAGGAEVNG